MFSRLKRRRSEEHHAAALYTAIVGRARAPFFYSVLGVADTIDGRFDMITLHAFLLFNRLKGRDGVLGRLSQKTFDIMFADMDRSLREMSVTDSGVPHRVKKMAQAFYGRVNAYDAALAEADDSALEEALMRNVFRGTAPDGAARRLVAYVRHQVAALAAVEDDVFAAGRVPFATMSGAAIAGNEVLE